MGDGHDPTSQGVDDAQDVGTHATGVRGQASLPHCALPLLLLLCRVLLTSNGCFPSGQGEGIDNLATTDDEPIDYGTMLQETCVLPEEKVEGRGVSNVF